VCDSFASPTITHLLWFVSSCIGQDPRGNNGRDDSSEKFGVVELLESIRNSKGVLLSDLDIQSGDARGQDNNTINSFLCQIPTSPSCRFSVARDSTGLVSFCHFPGFV
jgi:hypothetical protein